MRQSANDKSHKKTAARRGAEKLRSKRRRKREARQKHVERLHNLAALDNRRIVTGNGRNREVTGFVPEAKALKAWRTLSRLHDIGIIRSLPEWKATPPADTVGAA